MKLVASVRSMLRSAVCGQSALPHSLVQSCFQVLLCVRVGQVVRRSAGQVVRLSASQGFTLLEVIIAFTILGLMSGIIFSSFRMSLNSYQKSQERLDVEARKRVLQDHIKRQIGSLFPVRPSASFLDLQAADAQQPEQTRVFAQMPLFSGTSEAVTFATVAPLMLQENPGLTVVHYGLAQDEFGITLHGEPPKLPTWAWRALCRWLSLPPGKPLALIEDDCGFEISILRFRPPIAKL